MLSEANGEEDESGKLPAGSVQHDLVHNLNDLVIADGRRRLESVVRAAGLDGLEESSGSGLHGGGGFNEGFYSKCAC